MRPRGAGDPPDAPAPGYCPESSCSNDPSRCSRSTSRSASPSAITEAGLASTKASNTGPNMRFTISARKRMFRCDKTKPPLA